MKTATREHQWVEMVVTPVTVILTEGEPIVVSSGKESQVTVGCFACNMGLDEGSQIPCPGQDLFADDPESEGVEGGDADAPEG